MGVGFFFPCYKIVCKMRGLVSHILLSIDSDFILCPASFSHFLDLEFFVLKNPKTPVPLLVPHQHFLSRAARARAAAAAVWVRAVGEGRPTPAAMLAGQQGVSLLAKHLPSRARSLGRSTAASVAARSPHGAWPGALPGAAVPEPQPPARGGLFEEEPGSHRSRFFFFGKFLRNSKQSDDEFNHVFPFGPRAHAFSSSVLYPRIRAAAFLGRRPRVAAGVV